MLRLSRFASLLGVLAIAGSAFAQNITDVSPLSAAAGTELTITGTGFGVAKPKVQLFDAVNNKKYVLKVLSFTDTEIHATVNKAVLGDLALQVIVKGAPAPAEGPSPVTIEAPQVLSLSTSEAEPNTEFTIFGDFFGIKKGKLRVGAQNAKVLSWTMNEIHVLMPKKLYNATFPITIDNKVGVDADASIKVINSPIGIGKAVLNLFIEGQKLSLKFSPAVSVGGHIVIVGIAATNPVKTIHFQIPFDIATDTAPKPITSGATFVIDYLETGKISGFQIPPAAAWAAYGTGLGIPSVTITAASGGQVAGTVDAYLVKQYDTFGSPKPDPIHVTGDFVVDL